MSCFPIAHKKVLMLALGMNFFCIIAERQEHKSASIPGLPPVMADADAKIAQEWNLNAFSEWNLNVFSWKASVYKVEHKVEQKIPWWSRRSHKVEQFVLKRVNIKDPSDKAEYDQEVAIMGALKGEKHTLQLLKAETVDSWGYMLLPFVQYPDLLAFVKAALFLGRGDGVIWNSFGEAAAVQMSAAIKYLHSKGKGHGDLKLDNILVSEVAGGHVLSISKEPQFCGLRRKKSDWLMEECTKSNMIRLAIQYLQNGYVPTSFLLSDFGKSEQLTTDLCGELSESSKEKWLLNVCCTTYPNWQCQPRNQLNVQDIDAQMWTMSLLQLRHAKADDFCSQMKTLGETGRRSFKGGMDEKAFAFILKVLSEAQTNKEYAVDAAVLDGLLKCFAIGTVSATEPSNGFKQILDSIREECEIDPLEALLQKCSKQTDLFRPMCCKEGCNSIPLRVRKGVVRKGTAARTLLAMSSDFRDCEHECCKAACFKDPANEEDCKQKCKDR